MDRVIILGTGAAGLTAAIYTARADLAPLVVEGIQPGGQLVTTTEVENYPGFPEGVMGPELMDKMKRQAERFGSRFVFASATSVDFKKRPFEIKLDNGEIRQAHTVIIATGAAAKYLGLPSEQRLIGRGVSGCATCDGALFRNVPVAVVGGGDTAMEDATFLTRFASKVYIIHRRDQFRASPIMAHRTLANPKIEVIWNSVVEDVLDVSKNEVSSLKLKNVKTGQTSELPVKGLFVAIGHVPNTEIFKGEIDMDDKGYIRTRNTQTNVEGVFAAGDVQDPEYMQAVTAAGSGCMAALEAQHYLASKGL